MKYKKLKGLPDDGKDREIVILFVAVTNGWQVIGYQDDIKMMSFKKAGMRVNVYTTKMTVGTCLVHPKKGATQLFRKNVNLELLREIFKNPRVHTGKGYIEKAK